MQSKTSLLVVAPLLLAVPSFAQSPTVIGFDGGDDGGFVGNAFFEATDGNPAGNAHHLGQFFFNEIRTGQVGGPVNPNLVGDYSGFDEITFGLDIKVDSITDFIGNQIARPFGIKLIDRDIQGPSGSSGVYFEFGAISNSLQADWTAFSVTIDDPTAATLPTGWIGFGDEDPVTFATILPAGATFATVLAGVDEVHFTGAAPGFFFGFANFDLRIDNISLELPEPSIGTEICAGVANSTGVGANLDLSGSDVAADNDLTIQVDSLPLNQFSYIVHSLGTVVVMNPGGSQGNLCISGAPIGRFVSDVLDSGASGQVSFSPDLTMLPTPNGTVAAMSGETRYFQLWFRDVVGGMQTSNFSSAEGVTFQ